MTLTQDDYHGVFNGPTNHFKVYDATGEEVFSCEMRNSAVYNGYGHWGECPPGTFMLGASVVKDEPAFGYWFTPISDFAGYHKMHDFGRAGIGIHGGGSNLRYPFNTKQGWENTEGCLRVQNCDNEQIVRLNRDARLHNGRFYITVVK